MKFEAVGSDPSYPNSKIWEVKAATVTVSGNGRLYTKDELEAAAFTMSFRPLNINHNRPDLFPHARPLEYPANQTLLSRWDNSENAVITRIRIVDPIVNTQIEKGEINKASVEQVSNETCADSMCSAKIQYGMAYTALALVTHDVTPGDTKTEIRKVETVPFSQLVKQECSCQQKKQETTVEQVKEAVTEDMEKNIKAQYDLVVALAGKVALNPTDQHLQDEYHSARISLYYLLTDLMRLDKGETVANKFLNVNEQAVFKKAAQTLGKK